MDRFDEKAKAITLSVATIFQMSLGKPSETSAEEVIAQALREAAAEAFTEASTIMRFDPNGEYWPGRFDDEAAALRGKP